MAVRRPHGQKPLANEAACRGDANQAQRGEGEGDHGEGHAIAEAAELADILLAAGHGDGPGAEEQGDLGESVVGDVQQAAGDGAGGEQGHAEDDVGELADRGVGQTRLEIGAGQGDHRSDDDGEGDEIGGKQAQAGLGKELHPEQGQHHPAEGKNPGRDYHHRVQQGTHRGRRHHGVGQPGVQRHDPCLGEAEQKQQKGHGDQGCIRSWRKAAVHDAADREIEGAAQDIGQSQGRQQEGLGSEHQVDEVFSAAVIAPFVLMVHDQRIGKDGNHLVAEVEGEEAAGQGDPQAGTNG